MRALHVMLALACAAAPRSGAIAQQTAMPNNPHGPLRPGVDCSDCHSTADWKTMRRDAKFDHARDTRFPLTGKHIAVPCARCHLDFRFDEPKATPGQCAACHVDVHRGNLAGECSRCHTTSSFRDVQGVALHQRTRFPLTGAHLQVPCESCHKTDRGGAYTAVARECVACHKQARDAASTASVDHSGFAQDCSQCHATLSWAGGTRFNHAAVARGFVLDGAHALQRCAVCHTIPGFALRFAPPPTGRNDCVACHRPDYNRAHGSGWPTDCASCHNVSNWDASFDHAGFFPINSGAHRGTWSSCATCHTTSGDFKVFTCLVCHAHDQSLMDAKHSGRSGYSYNSQSCYNCHPRGSH